MCVAFAKKNEGRAGFHRKWSNVLFGEDDSDVLCQRRLFTANSCWNLWICPLLPREDENALVKVIPSFLLQLAEARVKSVFCCFRLCKV